jgi:hypothetical protein
MKGSLTEYIWLALATVLFTSCYSYRVNVKGDKDCTESFVLKDAYVVNPDLEEEYNILKKSGIFRLVPDSASAGIVHIKLRPTKYMFVCGTPLVGWAMFLGQLPLSLPAGGTFSFTEAIGEKEEVREIELQVYQRYWFWDMFSRKKNYEAAAGQALKIKYCGD